MNSTLALGLLLTGTGVAQPPAPQAPGFSYPRVNAHTPAGEFGRGGPVSPYAVIDYSGGRGTRVPSGQADYGRRAQSPEGTSDPAPRPVAVASRYVPASPAAADPRPNLQFRPAREREPAVRPGTARYRPEPPSPVAPPEPVDLDLIELPAPSTWGPPDVAKPADPVPVGRPRPTPPDGARTARAAAVSPGQHAWKVVYETDPKTGTLVARLVPTSGDGTLAKAE